MWVVVGRIGRPHGIRGEISLEVRTDEPDRRFVPGASLRASNGQNLTLDSVRWHSGRLLATFQGYPDRTAVEQLRGLIVEVERRTDEVPEGDDEYYDTALVGCTVCDVSGDSLGEVVEVSHLPSQDMLVIRTQDDREVLVPFITEFVPDVDVANRVVTVSPPPGLWDPED